MDNPIHKFFSSSDADLMHFALAPMVGKHQRNLSYNDWLSNTIPQLISYMASDSYLRVDDRPIVFDWQLPFGSAQEHRAALARLREVSRARFGVEPLVLVVLSGDDNHRKFLQL